MIVFLPSATLSEIVRDVLLTTNFSLAPLKGGLLNQNVLVTVFGKKYLLKVYRKEMDAQRIAEMHRVMEHVRKAGIPVPEFIKHLQRDGYEIALYTFLEGEHPSRYKNSKVRVAAMGEMLGRIQKALDTFEPSTSPATPQALVKKWHVEKFLREIEEVRSSLKNVSSQVRNLVESNLNTLETIIQSHQWPEEKFLHLPVVFAHDDFHTKNILFRGDVIVGVLDWEKSGWNFRGGELMRSVMFNCRRVARELSWPLVETYVRTYREAYGPWSEDERWTAFDCGMRNSLFSLWAVKEYIAGHAAVKSNVTRRTLLLSSLAKNQKDYREKLAKLLE